MPLYEEDKARKDTDPCIHMDFHMDMDLCMHSALPSPTHQARSIPYYRGQRPTHQARALPKCTSDLSPTQLHIRPKPYPSAQAHPYQDTCSATWHS